MKSAFLLLTLLIFRSICFGQGPVITQSDQWTYSFEDLSDLLRRYPAIYPVDYGTMGAPILYRAWGLAPWLFYAEREGIPLNRRYDGLFDGNLVPPAEIDTIRFSLLRGGPVGGFNLRPRSLPADSPYTEFQIREGYYGFGTVDFTHAQRIYHTAKFEASGRLVWYNGIRARTASRFNRVRAKAEVPLTKVFFGRVEYGGSLVDSESPLLASGLRTEREEANLCILRKDTLQARQIPSLNVYVRQDRERWSRDFRVRELGRGWTLRGLLTGKGQLIRYEQSLLLSTINFPGMLRARELTASLQVSDSIQFSRVGLLVSAGVRRESVWRKNDESRPQIVPDVGFYSNFSVDSTVLIFAGSRLASATVPVSWREGRYRVSSRPLMIAQEFADLTRSYVGSAYLTSDFKQDNLLISQLGTHAGIGRTWIEIAMLATCRPGNFAHEFVSFGDTVSIRWMKTKEPRSKPGVWSSASVPLGYGLRAESSWFVQAREWNRAAEELRGFSRLYFERSFFTSPLVIRSHVSYEHHGTRRAYSDRGTSVLSPAHLVGFRISGTIRGVTLIWGVDNFFSEHYQLMPGYPMIAKEEYVAFIWRLWL